MDLLVGYGSDAESDQSLPPPKHNDQQHGLDGAVEEQVQDEAPVLFSKLPAPTTAQVQLVFH